MDQPIAERLRWRLWRTVVRLRISTEHWMPSHGAVGCDAIGYSLPDGDHNMLGLLRSAIMPIGRRPKVVTIVNRDEGIVDRFARVFHGNDTVRLDSRFATEGAEAFAEAYLATNAQ